MSNAAIGGDRPLGHRYRLEQPDGTWWEVGWDRPLGTFYAQHYSQEPYDPFTPDEPLAWLGTRLSELPSVGALVSSMKVQIPEEIAEELQRDADAYPHTADPPFLQFAEAFSQAIDRRADVQRATLPAEPVAHVINGLRRDPYLAADDLATFAEGLGLDRDLARNIVDGTAEELHVDQIAHVCEAFRCSPYDLWGAQLGREILDAYGPERWPRYIEPLDDGREAAIDDTFIRRRVEQQAAAVVHVADGTPTRLTLEVTRFRQTAVLAVDADGTTSRVMDTLQPADPGSEYHFAFRRVAEPATVAVPLTSAAFATGCPAGHDATPELVDAASRLDRERPGTDMFRFTDLATGAEQWIGRETPFDLWQSWDDPRRYYPGDPAEVLDDRAVDLAPTLPFESRTVDPDADLEGVGLDL